jgi:hypothetical protein
MFDARRRQLGRLFFLLLIAGISHGQGPATTVVSDVVYRADGARAAGTLLISWPSFITANGEAVAGGTKSVTLGPQGALSVALIPNTGVTPTNAFYTVVFHLDDGTVTDNHCGAAHDTGFDGIGDAVGIASICGPRRGGESQ